MDEQMLPESQSILEVASNSDDDSFLLFDPDEVTEGDTEKSPRLAQEEKEEQKSTTTKGEEEVPRPSSPNCFLKEYHIPKKPSSVPSTSSGPNPPLSRSTSHLTTMKTARTIKVIDPQPQPLARSGQQTKWKPQQGGESKKIMADKFYKATPETMAKGGKRFAKTTKFQTEKEHREKVREKLRELALRDRRAPEESGHEEEEEEEEPAKAAVKVKQSKPKSLKLAEMDLIKPSTSRAKGSAPRRSVSPIKRRHSEEPSGVREKSERSRHSSSQGALFLEEEEQRDVRRTGQKSTSSVRRKAETFVDHSGYTRIKKLGFSNVLSNEGSQQLPLPSHTRPLQYDSISTSSASTASDDDGGRRGDVGVGARRKVAFKRDEQGGIAVEYFFIPKEGRGLPVKKEALKRHEMRMGLETQRQRAEQIVDELRRQAESLGPRSIGYNDMMRKILQWTTVWLTEQEKIKEAPPVQGTDLRLSHVPPVYENYRDYCLTYYPLLLHELWSSIYKDYQVYTREHCPTIMFSFVTRRNQEQWTELNLLALLTDMERRKESLLPTDGYLCRLEVRCSSRSGVAARPDIRVVFAYVIWSKIRRRNPNADVTYTKQLEEASIPGRRKHLNFVLDLRVVVKKMAPDLVIHQDKPMMCRGVSRIKPMLRNFHAVEDMTVSPLFGAIVCPTSFFPVAPEAPADFFRPDVRDLRLFRRMNPSQVKVVKNVAFHCTADLSPSAGGGRWPAPSPPYVSLVHGPPGTGKTNTIAALVLQIFSRWRQTNAGQPLPRVLLTAPSNAAVDEISLRIKGCEAGASVNLLRIGQEKMHPQMRQYR